MISAIKYFLKMNLLKKSNNKQPIEKYSKETKNA